MGEVATLEQSRPAAPMMAGGRPAAIVPQSMEDAYRLAKAICVAGMAPRGLETPEKAMVAILHGLEVGMTPMAALQRIAVVNGRPTIWGDGAIGLVRASGLCEYITETTSGTGDAHVATCAAKRRGEKAEIVRTFSVADAKKAGLWGKSGPWQQYPERMLQMRARAFALRDGFADVLGGLYLREEIEEAPMRDVTPPPAPPSPPPAPVIAHKPAAVIPPPAPTPQPETDAVREMVATSSQRPLADADIPPALDRRQKAPEADGEGDLFDAGSFIADMAKLLRGAESADDLQGIWEREVEPYFERVPESGQEYLQGQMRENARRFEP